jgi:hypothetical protein
MAVLPWLLWVLVSAPWPQLPSLEAWSQADAATRRLDPSEFVELPQVLRAELRRRGCTVPQTYTGGVRHNVVRGELKVSGTVDWVVLCSRERASGIVVFWGSDPSDVSEIARKPDADFLQVVASGQIGFSRAISIAPPDYIRERHQRYGGPDLSLLTHAGINDAFIGKASVVWYQHQGRWLQLTGAN